MILGSWRNTESIGETLRVSRRLRKMSADFELGMLTSNLIPAMQLPSINQWRIPVSQRIIEWANFDYIGSSSDWLSDAQYKHIESFKFFQRVAWDKSKFLYTPFRRIAAWAGERNNFKLPIEKINLWIYPAPGAYIIK